MPRPQIRSVHVEGFLFARRVLRRREAVGVYADYGYTPNPDLRGFNNDYPFPPELLVTNQAVLRRDVKLRGELKQLVNDTARGLDPAAKEVFHDWKESLRANLKDFPDGWCIDRKPE